jgi:hypothetical protein
MWWSASTTRAASTEVSATGSRVASPATAAWPFDRARRSIPGAASTTTVSGRMADAPRPVPPPRSSAR